MEDVLDVHAAIAGRVLVPIPLDTGPGRQTLVVPESAFAFAFAFLPSAPTACQRGFFGTSWPGMAWSMASRSRSICDPSWMDLGLRGRSTQSYARAEFSQSGVVEHLYREGTATERRVRRLSATKNQDDGDDGDDDDEE
ncbi:hypothetical protein EG329_006194 [Mollisiaceae sp. DMI_Dod_QoI]|nr:hypothetical protein EG329_006194 [Helotiales sp. DMI_Dod_QoI]